MEEDIDLRKYIIILIKNWRWIIGVSVVAAGVALIVSLILPPKYEAQTLVLVTKPRSQVTFESGFATTSFDTEKSPFQIYIDLAESDAVQGKLFELMKDQLSTKIETLANLQGKLEIEAENLSMLKLTATDNDPEQVAELANGWADLLVTEFNTLYGYTEKDVAFIESELKNAEADLQTAQNALIDFQLNNSINILEAELKAKRDILAKYLSTQHTISLIVEDAQNIKSRLTQREQNSTTLLTDELVTLFLEVNSLTSSRSLPIQLQLNNPNLLSEKTISEQLTLLDTLISTLLTQQAELEASIEAVQPEILQLQQERQKAIEAEYALNRELTLAKNIHETLSIRIKELRITVKDDSAKQMRVASQAVPPTESLPRGRLRNTAVAGILALAAGILWVFAKEWWGE